MAYRVDIYELTESEIVADREEADEIAEYQGRRNNNLTRITWVDDGQLDYGI
jgi:hypothetical protein